MWKAGATLLLLVGSSTMAERTTLIGSDTSSIDLTGIWIDSCPPAGGDGKITLSTKGHNSTTYSASEPSQWWSPTTCVQSGSILKCDQFKYLGDIANGTAITFGSGCNWRKISTPTPPPSPPPPTCSVCIGGICCNPNAPIPQRCPDMSICCDCGAEACQCPTAPTPSPSPDLSGIWIDSCLPPLGGDGTVTLAIGSNSTTYAAMELGQLWSPTTCVQDGNILNCDQMKDLGKINESAIEITFGFCNWKKVVTPAPPPPSPPTPIKCPGSMEPGEHYVNVTVDGLVRGFYVHVPEKQSDPRPLSIMYHLCTTTPKGSLELQSKMNEYTNARNYYNIYPIGARDQNYSAWNHGYAPYDCTTSVNDLKFTKAVLLYALEELCVDHTKLFAGGFRSGGAMAYNLSCEMPTYFRGFSAVDSSDLAGPFLGYLTNNSRPFVSFCGFCGDTIPDYWFNYSSHAAGCSDPVKVVRQTSTTTQFSHESCATGPMQYYAIKNLRYCWPGVSSEPACNTQDPGNIDASEAMLDFWDSLNPDPYTPSRYEMMENLKADIWN